MLGGGTSTTSVTSGMSGVGRSVDGGIVMNVTSGMPAARPGVVADAAVALAGVAGVVPEPVVSGAGGSATGSAPVIGPPGGGALPSAGPTTAATTMAGSGAVLTSVMSPVRTTPASVVTSSLPAVTVPRVTTTNAETSAWTTNASFVERTSRTRSTSRNPGPGINSSAPGPATRAMPMVAAESSVRVPTVAGSPPGRNSASPAASRATGSLSLPTTTAPGPSARRNPGCAVSTAAPAGDADPLLSRQCHGPSPNATTPWAMTSA